MRVIVVTQSCDLNYTPNNGTGMAVASYAEGFVFDSQQMLHRSDLNSASVTQGVLPMVLPYKW